MPVATSTADTYPTYTIHRGDVLTIAVLGALEVRRDGGPIAVPAGKSTEVLVRLAVEAGSPVRAERIIDDLWADDAFTTAKNTLQSKVSQLRRALGDPTLITSGPSGYTLHIAPANIDVSRVAGLAARASEQLRAGDDAAAAETASAGLELFRGDILASGGDGAWLRPHRARLGEIRMGLIEDRLAARVALGASGAAVGDLETLVAAHPLRERLWHTLISALYRTGRQADALAAYRRARRTLLDELGLEPGPELQNLESRILRHTADVGASTDPVPTIGNLPRPTSPLVGRDRELAEVAALVGIERLVTIVGPAGVGKTRLAIDVARGAAPTGGAWLVRLDAADPSTSVLQTIAETLHLASERQLVERIACVATLLVLDNCEHRVGAVAGAAETLLDATTGLRILATSQRPLGVDGESVHPLAPLPLPESVRLFTMRAAETRKDFLVDDVRAVVEDVCRSLDGLPLAIELAAARVKALSVQEIARRLDDRFVLLADPTSRRPERRRALAAAIGWSYDLLFPDDQRGLWALSCFAGGAPLAAAERVLAALGVPAAAALDVFGRLVDRSLVHADIAADGGVRYRLLESIRAFALERLCAAELFDDACRAHAMWFADAGEQIEATVRGEAQARRLGFVRDERANVDGALAWCAAHDPATGVRIANGFGWAWIVLGDGTAGAERVRGALGAAAGFVGEQDRVTGLLHAGWLEASAGDVERAEADLLSALEATRGRSARLRADAQRHIAFLRLMQGRPHDGVRRSGESLRVYRELGLAWEQAASLLLGASASMMLGDIAGATDAANEAVTLLTPIDDSWGLVHAEAMLGAIAQADHRFDDAARYLAHAATASEQLGFVGQAAYHMTKLGRVLHQSGDNNSAATTSRRAIAGAVACGDMRMATTARLNLARIHRANGDVDVALSLLRHVDACFRDAGGGDGALLTRSLIAAVDDDSAAATAILAEAEHRSDPEVQVLTLDVLARLAAQRGDVTRARELLRAADDALPLAHAVGDADRLDAHIARSLV